MAKPKKETWSKLDHVTRLERIQTLWNEGKSDQAIADALSATKGQVVGYRHLHLPGVTAATRGQTPNTAAPKVPPKIVQPKKAEELRMSSSRHSRTIEHTAGKASPGFAGKLTSDWHKQCDHRDDDNRQCGYHFTVQRGNEKRCNLHADEIL